MIRRYPWPILALFVAAPALGQSLYFDFGETAQTTAGNYNNITQAQDPIANAIDDSGAATGIALEITDAFWPGSNQSGTTTPSGDAAMFDVQATRDNLFGSTVLFGGIIEPTGGFTLSGLSSGATYDFTFFACRDNVSDIRETAYEIVGANNATVYLDSSNNTTNVVTAAGLMADGNGQIVVTVGPGPNNNNSSGFYYIGAMKLDIVPEPATLMLLGFGAMTLLRRRA